MSTYQYNSSKMRSAASTIRKELTTINENINKMNELCTNVQSSWKDKSSTKYIQKVEEKKNNVVKLVEQLDNLANVLDKCANNVDTNQQNVTKTGGDL
ncbi:MAG: WXG100 family type VII secretion target [Bacilli bacterium]|nr:WXG100 family type VII secretion target [Bacilli bacterium]